MPAIVRIKLFCTLFFVLLFSYGCGGGGGGGDSGGSGGVANLGSGGGSVSNASTSTVTTPISVFLVGQSGGSVTTTAVINGVSTTFNQANLVAFDPKNPAMGTTLLALAGQYSNEISIEHGVYDSASKTLRDPYIQYVMFVSGNRFIKVNLATGAIPAATQVSNESSADNLCSFNRKQLVDYANPDNTAIAYSLKGADNVCGTSDDDWRIIRLSMSAAESPIPAKPPVTGLINSAGAAIGWLAVEGNELKRYDANFQNPVSLMTFSGTAEEVTRAVFGFEQPIVRLGTALYQYDAVADSLTPVFTFALGGNPGTLIASARDSSAAYLAVNYPVAGITKIYRAPLVGNGATEIASEPGVVLFMTTSLDRVVYVTAPAFNVRQLKSTLKLGGATPAVLPILGATSFSGNSGIVLTAGNKIYYNVQRPNDSPVAGVMDDDGLNVAEVDGARWLGIAFSSALRNLSSVSAPFRLIRADGVVATAGVLNFADATISSFNPATTALIGTLGTLPSTTIDSLAFDKNKGFGLGQATKSNGGGYDADLFVVNPDAPGVIRVTNNIL